MNYRPWVVIIVFLASTLVRGDNAEETAKMAAAKTYYKIANLENLWKDKLAELAKAVPDVERENYLASIKPCFEQLVWAGLDRVFTLGELMALAHFNNVDGPGAMIKLSEFIDYVSEKLDDELPTCQAENN